MIDRLTSVANRVRRFLRRISDGIHSNWWSRFCLLGVLILVSIFGWSAVVNWALRMMESIGTKPAEAFASFVMGYEGGGVAATIYWSLVSLPFFAGLWYLRTHDTLAQARRTERANKSTLDSLNETLFHNASMDVCGDSESGHDDRRKLKAVGLLTLKKLRDEYPERFMDRVDRVTSQGLNLFGVDLSSADLSKMQLANISLQGAELTRVNFTDATLTEATFARTRLKDANPSNANLSGAALSRTKFTEAYLTKANLTEANFTDATLTEANFTDATLTKANFTGATFTEADPTKADPTGANFTDATLTKANFTGAGLMNTNFTGAKLPDADFTDANLWGADFTGATLDNADFNRVDVGYAKLPFDSADEALKVLKNFGYRVGKGEIYVGRPD